jgi:hypothetical protein
MYYRNEYLLLVFIIEENTDIINLTIFVYKFNLLLPHEVIKYCLRDRVCVCKK